MFSLGVHFVLVFTKYFHDFFPQSVVVIFILLSFLSFCYSSQIVLYFCISLFVVIVVFAFFRILCADVNYFVDFFPKTKHLKN